MNPQRSDSAVPFICVLQYPSTHCFGFTATTVMSLFTVTALAVLFLATEGISKRQYSSCISQYNSGEIILATREHHGDFNS